VTNNPRLAVTPIGKSHNTSRQPKLTKEYACPCAQIEKKDSDIENKKDNRQVGNMLYTPCGRASGVFGCRL
jgi:hypothetical protein